jgi:hypothetical protein
MPAIDIKLKRLARDVAKCARIGAVNNIAEIERRIRNLNDELADECSKLKAAKTAYRKLCRGD